MRIQNRALCSLLLAASLPPFPRGTQPPHLGRGGAQLVGSGLTLPAASEGRQEKNNPAAALAAAGCEPFLFLRCPFSHLCRGGRKRKPQLNTNPSSLAISHLRSFTLTRTPRPAIPPPVHVPRRSQPDLSDALPTSARKSLSFRQQLQPPSSRSLLPPPQVTVAAAASASSFSILSDSTNRVAAPRPFVDVPADLLSGTPLPDEAAIFRAMHGWDGVGGRQHRADLEDGDGDLDDEENSNRSSLWILKRANPVFSSDDEYESPPKRSRGCGSGGTVSARPSDEDHGDCASDDAEPREDLAAVEREADRAAPPSPFCLPERHLPEAAEEGPGTVLDWGLRLSSSPASGGGVPGYVLAGVLPQRE